MLLKLFQVAFIHMLVATEDCYRVTLLSHLACSWLQLFPFLRNMHLTRLSKSQHSLNLCSVFFPFRMTRLSCFLKKDESLFQCTAVSQQRTDVHIDVRVTGIKLQCMLVVFECLIRSIQLLVDSTTIEVSYRTGRLKLDGTSVVRQGLMIAFEID